VCQRFAGFCRGVLRCQLCPALTLTPTPIPAPARLPARLPAVLAYATSHLSGGQMNPAVTLGLVLAGSLGPVQGAANMVAQVRQACQELVSY
jgi:hypothetical protein